MVFLDLVDGIVGLDGLLDMVQHSVDLKEQSLLVGISGKDVGWGNLPAGNVFQLWVLAAWGGVERSFP